RRKAEPIMTRLLLFAALLTSTWARAEIFETDVVVFGGNAAGVSAACTAARLGKNVVVTEFGRHVGGLTSGGLGWTDIGNKAAIGGFSRTFYQRLGRHYGKPEAWYFEPSVAEQELRALLAEAKVPIHFEQRLASATFEGARIVEITMEDGNVYRGKMFIDCSYEGDLMAKAGVKYMVGREANDRFGETLNGVRAETPKHQFLVPVDPYVKPRDPTSGLLPFVRGEALGEPGSGDSSVQAYNFRLCLTKNPRNRKPIDPPPGYDPARYELLGRYFVALAEAGKKVDLGNFLKIDMVTPEKTDINNQGGFSTDYIGMSDHYAEADYETRERIWNAHIEYIQGFLTFLATDARVPENVRREMKEWGLCRDEFQDTGGWPHQMYIREARRMLSAFVMSEPVCRGVEKPEDAVGLGAYNMDSHNCRRIVRDGNAYNEGDVQIGVKPYPISYRSIVPRIEECENLLVPVALSATHIAYGSIRMEPVFMILGQSAATAAVRAIDEAVPVQKVAYANLRERLLADGQVLEWVGESAERAVAPARKLPGIVLDDRDAERKGDWVAGSLKNQRRVGDGYVHDGNERKGELAMTWTPDISQAGRYEIIIHFPPHPNRASNARVTVTVGNAQSKVTVNERQPSGSQALGVFDLPNGKATSITLSNAGSDGYVVADGIQLLPRDR
ncbi:MAG: FAD-dependent oxidoreductase, partial [Chthoniobacteraceae bacterium]